MNSSVLDPNGGATAYEWVSVIGTGAYGTVYRARDTNGTSVAIKKIRIATSEEGMPMSMIREVAMLKQLENYEHPNIVRLKDVFTGMKNGNELRLMLVFEYIDQDLSQYLEKCPSPGLGPHTIKSLMHQMLNGIDFLHSHRIVHRDLKPQNILVNSHGDLKIADFGLARVYAFSMALTSVVVTLWYRAPEVLLQDAYCTAVDLWSCGCIFAELFNRKPLFCGQSEVDQLHKIFQITGLPSDLQWPTNVVLPRASFKQFDQTQKKPWCNVVSDIDMHATDLLEKLLTFDQHKRLCARDALTHPYILEDLQTPAYMEENTHNASLNGGQSGSSDSNQYISSPNGCHDDYNTSGLSDENSLSLASPTTTNTCHNIATESSSVDALLSHEEIIDSNEADGE